MAGANGAGIRSLATLALRRCTLSDNHGTNDGDHFTASGGAISAGGTTTLTDCLVLDSSADNVGGGIYNGGALILAGETEIRGNSAFRGGGLWGNGGTVEIGADCRITGNSAFTGNGGGIANNVGTVTLAGPDPSPIVVNNCEENCVGDVPKCAATPVSCPA